mmetsp:Transcript_47086/g.74324  ORF Transcript_47086/g.74324 Transcript_47086/m.74324 type:complete len:484 (+) Transcript_47086:155-1606(+)
MRNPTRFGWCTCVPFFTIGFNAALGRERRCEIEDTQSLLQAIKIEYRGAHEGEDKRDDTYPPLQSPHDFDKDFVKRDSPRLATNINTWPSVKAGSADATPESKKFDENYVHQDFSVGMTDNVEMELMVHRVTANATDGLQDVRSKRQLAVEADKKFQQALIEQVQAQNATLLARHSLSAKTAEVEKARTEANVYGAVLNRTSEATQKVKSYMVATEKVLPNATQALTKSSAAIRTLVDKVAGLDADLLQKASAFENTRKTQHQVIHNFEAKITKMISESWKKGKAGMVKMSDLMNVTLDVEKSEKQMEKANADLAVARRNLTISLHQTSARLGDGIKAYLGDVGRVVQAKADKLASGETLSFLQNLTSSVAQALNDSQKQHAPTGIDERHLREVLASKERNQSKAASSLLAARNASELAHKLVLESVEDKLNATVQAMYNLEKGIGLREPFEDFTLIMKKADARSLILQPLWVALLIWTCAIV